MELQHLNQMCNTSFKIFKKYQMINVDIAK